MNTIDMVVTRSGDVRVIFDDLLDSRSVGAITIQRASHVEPTADGRWTADLSPVDGPIFGPFDKRMEALKAEVTWLRANWLARPSA